MRLRRADVFAGLRGLSPLQLRVLHDRAAHHLRRLAHHAAARLRSLPSPPRHMPGSAQGLSGGETRGAGWSRGPGGRSGRSSGGR
eukprot:3409244-Rhodomonas_salina.1